MKKFIYSTTIFLTSWFMLISPAIAKTFDSQIIDDPLKVWNIHFNSEVPVDETTKNFIYIQTDAGEKHPLTLQATDDSKTVAIHPTKPFLLGKTYSIVIEKDIPSTKGKQLKRKNHEAVYCSGDIHSFYKLQHSPVNECMSPEQ